MVITITAILESDIIYYTVQIHREQSLLALKLGLKYEIHVLTIGWPNALWPQPNYFGVHGPTALLSRPMPSARTHA